MVSTIWVLTGNAAVPRLRLGQLFRGFRMRCGGGEARGEIRKFPQIAQPTAKSGSQAVGGGVQPSWGAAGQLAQGPRPWEAGQGAGIKQVQHCLLFSLLLMGSSGTWYHE